MLEKYIRLIDSKDKELLKSNDFNFLSKYLDQPEVFDKYADLLHHVDFSVIVCHEELNINFIKKYKDKIDFNIISFRLQKPDVIEYLFDNHFDRLNNYHVYHSYNWDRPTYLKYQNKINHKEFTSNYDSFKLLSLKDIYKYKDEINWHIFHLAFKRVKNNFYLYRRYAKYIKWNAISYYPDLPNSFIEEFADRLNLYNLTSYNKLSQRLIEKFYNKVNWRFIAFYYELTPKFIEKHREKLFKYNPDKYRSK